MPRARGAGLPTPRSTLHSLRSTRMPTSPISAMRRSESFCGRACAEMWTKSANCRPEHAQHSRGLKRQGQAECGHGQTEHSGRMGDFCRRELLQPGELLQLAMPPRREEPRSRWSLRLSALNVSLRCRGTCTSVSLPLKSAIWARRMRFLALSLILLAMVVLARADAVFKVGVTTRDFIPVEPYDWRGAKTHALRAMIWYPAAAQITPFALCSVEQAPVTVPAKGPVVCERSHAMPSGIAAARPANKRRSRPIGIVCGECLEIRLPPSPQGQAFGFQGGDHGSPREVICQSAHLTAQCRDRARMLVEKKPTYTVLSSLRNSALTFAESP